MKKKLQLLTGQIFAFFLIIVYHIKEDVTPCRVYAVRSLRNALMRKYKKRGRKMKYTPFGKTGFDVSLVGFGGIPIQRGSVEDAKKAIYAAHDNGINFIDTARGYTVSEEYIGASLGDLRKDFFLATKAPSMGYDKMKADIETSLKNLRTDCIDLYQLHNVKSITDLLAAFKPDGSYRALAEAKKEGKIRYIGITSHIKEVLIYAIELHSNDFVSVMYPYNIVETEGIDMFRKAKAAGLGTLAMKPMGGGNLDDPKLALRFIANNPYIDVALVGIGDAKEAHEDSVIELGDLTAEEVEECKAIRQKLGTEFCRRCGYCAPCTVGIDIPTNFTFQNYLKNYDLAEWAKDRYNAMKVKADACIKCGVCETRCPYNLKIREKLASVARDFSK